MPTFPFRLIFLTFMLPASIIAQQYVDTLYSFQTVFDVSYGNAIDFAGTTRELKMDISQPIADEIPECGRPLLVMVHGGAWLAGEKGQGTPKRIREEFAMRGYTTASISYRLGQFHTNLEVNCNIPFWNCYNMTDSSEWYRANFRGIQDLNGAIRYLVNNADTYNIDPNNIFLVGESAGGFIAMGAGFIDSEDEVEQGLVGEYPDAPPPHQIYSAPCIQELGFAPSISSMDLSRPALGSYSGALNQPALSSYEVKGVGNFFGGAFNNIFQGQMDQGPALYLFHQPCDLVVPYNRSKVLKGFVECAMGFPAFCGNIINRPLVYGSLGIKNLIDQLIADGQPAPEYLFDNSNNNFLCIQQINNPSQECHAFDNYWLRSSNMAEFFAPKIENCTITGVRENSLNSNSIKLFPNPLQQGNTISISNLKEGIYKLEIFDLQGRLLFEKNNLGQLDLKSLDISKINSGTYILSLKSSELHAVVKLVVAR